MKRRSTRTLAVLIAATGGLALAAPTAAFASTGSPHHQRGVGNSHDQRGDLTLNQVNLASDIPGTAPLTDPDQPSALLNFDLSDAPEIEL